MNIDIWTEGEEFSEDDTRNLRTSLGSALMGKGHGLIWILGMSWGCARNVPSKYGSFLFLVSSFAFSQRKSRQSTRPQTMRMVGPSTMTKVSAM